MTNRTTELLRKGLIEHGIEWRNGLEGVTFVGDWCFVEYDDGKLAATCGPALTSEQAIAAALGSWTNSSETANPQIRCMDFKRNAPARDREGSHALLPCPFCGSEYTQVRWIGFKDKDNGAFEPGFRGECTECYALTRAFNTEAEAIAAWNTRATLGSELNPDGLPIGLTISDDGNLLDWRGENYVRQFGGTLTAEQVMAIAGKHQPGYCSDVHACFDWKAIADKLNAMLGNGINGETSDGYHTFNELYHHRAVLFSVIVCDHRELAWKARKHHDGTMYDGMFIVGIETPKGQATYHYDIDPYWDMFDCEEREFAPEWDGHTPDDAIARIAELGSGTCEYIIEDNMNETEGAGDVWFRCTHCNMKYNYLVDSWLMKMPYCPNCGQKVTVTMIK